MATNQTTGIEAVHGLLFRALLEMRSQGHEKNNKVVFHLADLFHNVVLEMRNAGEDRCTYDEVMQLLEQRAQEKGLERWVRQNLEVLNERVPMNGVLETGK